MKIKIFHKFFLAFVLVGAGTILLLSFWYYHAMSDALINRTFDQLYSVNVLKKQQVNLLFKNKDFTINELNNILFETTGMGATGESYLVNDQLKMLSISRFFPKAPSKSITVNTLAAQRGLKHLEGHAILKDYRNVDVFSVYSFINLNGIDYALISEIDFSEAIKPVKDLRNKIILASLIILGLIFFVSLLLTNQIVLRIRQLQQPINSLALGIIPENYMVPKDTDEIGEMSQSVEVLIQAFKKVTTLAFEIGQGNLTYHIEPLSEKDILSKSLLKMRDQLLFFNQREKEIQRQRSYLLLEGEERERKRMARELHDSLGQMLTGLRMRLDLMPNNTQGAELKNIVDEVLKELKQISHNLMPTVLADFGLEAALSSLCESITKANGLAITLRYEKAENYKKISFETAVFLYRIVQESFTNVIKHASASKVNLSIDKFEDRLFLYIKDNGSGFDATKDYDGQGLKNIKERVALLQGECEITSSEEGTIINIEIPFI